MISLWIIPYYTVDRLASLGPTATEVGSRSMGITALNPPLPDEYCTARASRQTGNPHQASSMSIAC